MHLRTNSPTSSKRTTGGRMKFNVLVALLVATGCAQSSTITANNCEVVAYQSVSGEAGYTSGINYPWGQYRGFVDLVMVQDH
jgi:hypothetical protein